MYSNELFSALIANMRRNNYSLLHFLWHPLQEPEIVNLWLFVLKLDKWHCKLPIVARHIQFWLAWQDIYCTDTTNFHPLCSVSVSASSQLWLSVSFFSSIFTNPVQFFICTRVQTVLSFKLI